MTQKDMVLQYMLDNGSISQWEAMRDIGCLRLSARINDLRKAGHRIITVMETRPNRYGKPVSYARYREVQQ